MTITINLSEETEKRIVAEAQAQGTEPSAFLADLIEDAYGVDTETEDPEAVEEIGQALDEYEAMRARGENGIPASVVHADLRAALLEQRHMSKSK